MYYFRDCYFDQQLSFGVARASLAGTRRHPKKRAKTGPSQGSALDYVMPFLCIGFTFGVGLMVLDVLGLEHLAQAPSFEALDGYAEYMRSIVDSAIGAVPIFRVG